MSVMTILNTEYEKVRNYVVTTSIRKAYLRLVATIINNFIFIRTGKGRRGKREMV